MGNLRPDYAYASCTLVASATPSLLANEGWSPSVTRNGVGDHTITLGGGAVAPVEAIVQATAVGATPVVMSAELTPAPPSRCIPVT